MKGLQEWKRRQEGEWKDEWMNGRMSILMSGCDRVFNAP
jgi:hypothetical protein